MQKVIDIVKAVPLSEIFRSVEEADRYLDRIQTQMLRDAGAKHPGVGSGAGRTGRALDV